MKKLLYITFTLLLFSNICVYASNDVVSFDLGISSGISFYGNNYIVEQNNSVNNGEFNRVSAGINGDISFKLASPLRFIVGSDILADFVWGGNSYFNHLDYAFYWGIKIYPNLYGLNTSFSYLLGRRTDFISNEENGSYIESSAWGNGFRISLEYDFAYGRGNVFAPAVGCYYRCVPRGDNYWDNILALYINFSF